MSAVKHFRHQGWASSLLVLTARQGKVHPVTSKEILPSVPKSDRKEHSALIFILEALMFLMFISRNLQWSDHDILSLGRRRQWIFCVGPTLVDELCLRYTGLYVAKCRLYPPVRDYGAKSECRTKNLQWSIMHTVALSQISKGRLLEKLGVQAKSSAVSVIPCFRNEDMRIVHVMSLWVVQRAIQHHRRVENLRHLSKGQNKCTFQNLTHMKKPPISDEKYRNKVIRSKCVLSHKPVREPITKRFIFPVTFSPKLFQLMINLRYVSLCLHLTITFICALHVTVSRKIMIPG